MQNSSNKPSRTKVSLSNNRYRISPDTVANRVGDKTILVNIKTDRIFSLNSTGGRLWELLASGSSLAEIHQIMGQEFDVAHEQLVKEIQNLIKSFEGESLIIADHAS